MNQTRKNLCFVGLLAALTAGCGDDNPEVATGTTIYPEDYYGYAYYYPADLAYSVPYWVDDWYAYPYLYSDTQQPLTDASGQGAGSLIRAIAIGDDPCPGQVSVEPQETEVLCGGDDDQMLRTGASVTFDGCTLPDGSQLNGSVNFNSRRSFSNNSCAADTVVSVAFSSTYTDLVYTGPSGARSVIPTLTSEGSYTRLFLDRPAAVSLANSGTLEEYDAAGVLSTMVDLAGSFGVVIGQPPDTWDYRVYGPMSMQDAMQGKGVTLTAVDLIHEEVCCHPISGSLRIAHTDTGEDDVLTFGPACGEGQLNDDPVSLPACP